MRYNILFVDDEEQILKSYKRVLRGKDNFSVYTANGAQEGLSNISSKDREYQIIVSDYKMPDMNGVDFLNKAKQYSPNSIKVMLTGEADLKATMSAINEIGIFKLLLKPCQTEDLISILNQCIKQYELVISEKVLLQKTLSGTVNMLTDMLSILRPDVFSIAIIQKERAKHIACKIGLESISWQIGLASIFSYLSYTLLPSNTIEEVILKPSEALLQDLSQAKKSTLAWIEEIPRLEGVYKIISKYYETIEQNDKWISLDKSSDPLEIGANILSFLHDYESEVINGNSSSDALQKVSKNYNKNISMALQDIETENKEVTTMKVKISELTSKMTFAEDIFNKSNVLLVRKGQQATPAIITGLSIAIKNGTLTEPMLVNLNN